MTHPQLEVERVLELGARGMTATAVARATGLPRRTIVDWLAGRVPARRERQRVDAAPDIDSLPPTYAYLLGLYLGDGCISAHPRGVYRMRIFLDVRYPAIVDACEQAIHELVPTVKVHRLLRTSKLVDHDEPGHVEVSAYSKSWPRLFPQHGPGRKHERAIVLTGWQHEFVARHPELLLRGLIHSDGCRFVNTGTNWRAPRYSFSNRSEDILRIFCHGCDLLGLRYTFAPRTVYVSRKADVARMDAFIGPKA
jgi:hypothetical protein